MDFLQWLRALFALTATLALIAGVAWGARRFGMMQLRPRGVPERRMRVVERLMLDPRRTLVLVRLDESEHLLLLSAAGDCVVTKQDAPPQPAASAFSTKVEAGFVSENAPMKNPAPEALS